MSNWYRTGLISVTSGESTVTGDGTCDWQTAVNRPMAGDIFTDNERIYEIASVDSDDQLTLETPYLGVTKADAPYAIILSASSATNTRIAAQVTEVLEKLGDKVTVSTSAPTNSQGNDGDIWIVAGQQ